MALAFDLSGGARISKASKRRKERCGAAKNNFRRLRIRCRNYAGWRTVEAGFFGVTRGGMSTRERLRNKWKDRAGERCTMQNYSPQFWTAGSRQSGPGPHLKWSFHCG